MTRWLFLLGSLGLLLPAMAGAQGTGPRVGSEAPAFTLPDQQGRDRSLESLLGRGTLAIVFFRSADW